MISYTFLLNSVIKCLDSFGSDAFSCSNQIKLCEWLVEGDERYDIWKLNIWRLHQSYKEVYLSCLLSLFHRKNSVLRCHIGLGSNSVMPFFFVVWDHWGHNLNVFVCRFSTCFCSHIAMVPYHLILEQVYPAFMRFNSMIIATQTTMKILLEADGKISLSCFKLP